MIRKRICRLVASILCLCMLFSLFTACGKGKDAQTEQSATQAQTVADTSSTAAGEEKSQEPLLEYTFYGTVESGPSFAADDVITPLVESKFNIKVKEVFFNQGMTMKERMNLFIASDQLPDVVYTINDNVTIPSTGRYAELGELIKENCPNLMKWYPEEEWKDTLYNGKMYTFPALILDGSFPQFKDDVYASPGGNWAGLWTKESILKKLGYSFTPLKDIYAKINETGVKPTAEDLKIEPAIATPDDFYNFLKKIKETIPEVNGKPMIPFSMPIWLEPHFGAMFGLTGSWKYNPATKKVSQFLGDEHAKEYWQYMNKLYNEGLIDQDFALQKIEQHQEKGVQGRVACSMFYPNSNDVQAAIKQADPNDTMRMIPMPIQPGVEFVGIDALSKATYKFFINKDFKDIPRLLKLFDWGLSDEAMALLDWGPESLGLWEMKDGKRVWKDEKLYQALVNSDQEYLKNNYYSKGMGAANWRNSKALACIPMMTMNTQAWNRSYPFKVQESDFNYHSAYISGKGSDWAGRIASPVDDVTKLAVDFTYGEFEQQHSAKLFAAKNEAEFEKNWNDLQKYLEEKCKYTEAKKRMELEYESRGLEVVK